MIALIILGVIVALLLFASFIGACIREGNAMKFESRGLSAPSNVKRVS